MSEVEAIRNAIHSNLLLAKTNMEQNNLARAMHRVEDERMLLEQLEVLILQTDKNRTNTPLHFVVQFYLDPFTHI